ncbi:MAG TPA: VWA domain-containing protein [Candidatus Acidoferrum sp.]|jgi:VWFA-related protein
MKLPPACKFALCAGLAFVLSAASSGAQEAPASNGQTIQVNVDRVDVGVVVTDAKGNFVQGLKRENFHVFDNGVEQPISEFAPVEQPGQIFLLVEAGPAVYFLQDTHLFAADTFLNGLSAGDRVAIGRYAEAPVVVLAFTEEKRAAQAALTGVRFNLGFGQLNLSSSLNTVLDWLAPVSGKKTIVLLSTGVDTSPQTAIEAIQARLRTSEVRVLAVSLSGPMRNGKVGNQKQVQQTQQAFAEADARLHALAEATGGRAYFPQNAKAFPAIYKQMAQFIRNEYSLSFAPPISDGALHQIDVKVELPSVALKTKLPDYRVDHRRAYIAPKASAAQ